MRAPTARRAVVPPKAPIVPEVTMASYLRELARQDNQVNLEENLRAAQMWEEDTESRAQQSKKKTMYLSPTKKRFDREYERQKVFQRNLSGGKKDHTMQHEEQKQPGIIGQQAAH